MADGASSASLADVAVRKRSVAVDGYRTSISMEEAFWNELIALSRERGMAINALVAELDLGRGLDGANLSSALRIFIPLELKKQHAFQRAGLLVV